MHGARGLAADEERRGDVFEVEGGEGREGGGGGQVDEAVGEGGEGAGTCGVGGREGEFEMEMLVVCDGDFCCVRK